MTGLVQRGLEGSNGKISRMFMPDGSEHNARGTLGKEHRLYFCSSNQVFDSMRVRTLACTLVQNNLLVQKHCFCMGCSSLVAHACQDGAELSGLF